MCVKDGHEIDPGHQQIVAHIVLTLYGRSSAKISADCDIRSTRYVAGLSKREEGQYKWRPKSARDVVLTYKSAR